MKKFFSVLFLVLLGAWFASNTTEIEGIQQAWLIPLIMGAGALASGIGSIFKAKTDKKNAEAQNKRLAQTDQMTSTYLNQLGGPSSLENQGFANWMNAPQFDPRQFENFASQSGFQMPELPNVYRDLGLATDPILQSMRGGSNDSAISSNLLGLLNTGNPYDTALISGALDPIRQRALSREVASLQAAAPGLGSRFGSAVRRGEVDLRRQSLEDSNALDAQMLFAAHESAQGRRLQAAGQLTARDQLQLQRDQSALQALLGQAGIGIQQGQLNLGAGELGLNQSKLNLDALLGGGQLGIQQQGVNNALYQTLLQAQTNRQQQYLGGLGLMSGQQVTPVPGYGGAIGDAGLLALLYANQMKGRTSSASPYYQDD